MNTYTNTNIPQYISPHQNEQNDLLHSKKVPLNLLKYI